MDITPTLGLFFSFFELRGAEKGGSISLRGISRKNFLQAYTTNYKGFKDKFLWVKSGKRCPQVMYALDGHYHFPIYWSNNPLSISSFDYDKLNALKIWALAVFDSFRVVKVKDLLQMDEDPEQISSLLGNAYVSFFYCFLTTLFIFIFLDFCFVFSFHLTWQSSRFPNKISWWLKPERGMGTSLLLKVIW